MADKTPPQLVPIHYIKSRHFRVVHADGAIGGITPHLLIQMGLYSERIPIPTKQVFELSAEGTLTDPPRTTETRDGVVREVEAEVLLDLNTAKALAIWLSDQVAKAEMLGAKR